MSTDLALVAEPVEPVIEPEAADQPNRLAALETIIHTGQQSYVAIGKALAEIQEKRLYKHRYATFELYCEKRWGFERQQAYNYIAAAQVAEHVHLNGQNAPALTQAVQIARIEDPEKQKELATKIGDFSTKTVKDVQRAVNGVLGKKPAPEAEPSKPPKEISLEEALDKFVSKIVLQSYGYYGAKFANYPNQHTTDCAIIDATKKLVWKQINEISGRRTVQA